MERGSACNLLECCYKRQLPNPLSYTTVVMTCAFSLQLQTVMHTHLYWLAAKDTDEEPSKGRGAILPILHALSDLKAKPKTEMCKLHRLGVPKQTQSITATGRTSDCWARSQLQMLSEP